MYNNMIYMGTLLLHNKHTRNFWTKHGLRPGQYKTRTADCGLRTTDCGLGIKYGLGIRCGLRTEYKTRTRYKTRTTDYVYKNSFRR